MGLLSVVLGTLGAWWYLGAGTAGDAANKVKQAGPKPIPVTIQTVQQRDFAVYLDGLGSAQPYDTVTVRSRVDGQVVKVGFRQGEMVRQGELLVQIDTRPFQAALEQAQAKKAQDEATLGNATHDLERYQTLADRGAGSLQQLDTQRALVNQLTAQIKGDQAAIDNAQTQLDYTTIRSPLTGMAGFRQIDPGNIVHATDTTGIVTIVKLQPISVVFSAPEQNVQEIKQALAAGTVPVTALSSDGTKVLAQGHLAIINNQVDQASGTIQMKATFPNGDNALWPGLSVSTRLTLKNLKNVVVAPNDAILRGPNGLYAYAVTNNDKVAVRPVTSSYEGTDGTVVTEGLRAGDRVVVAGQYRLTPNARVAAHEQEGSPPAVGQSNAQAFAVQAKPILHKAGMSAAKKAP